MATFYEPFPYGVGRSRRIWDSMIKRYGNLALLRQPDLPDRFVSILSANFTALERQGGISNPTDRKVLLSAFSPGTEQVLDPEPSERDMLVTLSLNDDGSPVKDASGNPVEDEHLKLVAPPARIGPSRKQLYWVLQARA